ncbi:MAG: FlgD immunoglobulin-like domain containing protein [Elusimicrobiota bacterium]
MALRVSGDTRADLEITGGVRVGGSVRLPEGRLASRPFSVSLADGRGRSLREAVLNFNNQSSAGYVFDKVADGAYSVVAADLGYPKAFSAKPRLVEVAGADIEDHDILLYSGGNIKGRIAVERTAPDGSREFVLVAADNRSLLPPDFRMFAVANPWFQGGFFPARGLAEAAADGGVLIDAQGQFTIPAVLPGLYDVEFNVFNSTENTRGGSLDLLSGVRSGVTVVEGRTADIGTVRVRASATLSGRVTDAATGEGLANITILARRAAKAPGEDSPRRRPPETATDSGGGYQLRGLDVEARFYDIFVAAREEDPGGRRPAAYKERLLPSVDIRSTTTLDVSLAPAAFSVSGRVAAPDAGTLFSDGGSEARAGALLYVQREDIIPVRNPVADILVRTRPDGRFTVPDLATGTYRLTAAAAGYAPAARAVTISTASVDMGTLTLGSGARLTGGIRASDGTSPGEDEIVRILAATPGMVEVFGGSLASDPVTRTVSGYSLSGFRPGVGYRVVLVTGNGELMTPEEGRYVVFESSVDARAIDLVFRRAPPFVLAKSRREGGDFLLEFRFSHPLRSRTADDDDLDLILATAAAQGSLSARELSESRLALSAVYAPAVGESSFTLRARAFSALRDPDSIDADDPEFVIDSAFTFYSGVDGYHKTSIPNLTGGSLVIEGDGGRVTLPQGAFFVDASSSVRVALQRSDELLEGAQALRAGGLFGSQANIRSLRYAPQAYPSDVFRALAATPPEVNPFSPFYDVLLPDGVRRALAKPAQLTVSYPTGIDPADLNLYWYNAAANSYILQQDVTGASPVIDAGNRTITFNIDHFSTFVLFDTGVAVISGGGFGGGTIEAFNFPNPFDLAPKTVQAIHGSAGGPNHTVRGTMIRFAVPGGLGGAGFLRIFNVAGERVRTMDLGALTGGRYHYQPWDGRNDSGRDVASGVYIAQIKIGGQSTFFKMAVIK